jgi:hypothetical protein
MMSEEAAEWIDGLLEEYGTSGLFYRLCPDQSLRGFWQMNLRKEGTEIVAHFVCMWTPEDIQAFSEYDPEEMSFEEACRWLMETQVSRLDQSRK